MRLRHAERSLEPEQSGAVADVLHRICINPAGSMRFYGHPLVVLAAQITVDFTGGVVHFHEPFALDRCSRLADGFRLR